MHLITKGFSSLILLTKRSQSLFTGLNPNFYFISKIQYNITLKCLFCFKKMGSPPPSQRDITVNFNFVNLYRYS